jgi:isoleucyl-tRNA synthetase
VLITSTASVAPFVQAPADAVVTEVSGLKLKIVKSATPSAPVAGTAAKTSA